jgi:hypothetical protein
VCISTTWGGETCIFRSFQKPATFSSWAFDYEKVLDSLFRQRYNTDNFIQKKPVRKSSTLHKRTIQRVSDGESETESGRRMDF